jgi:voltage-gated potassium channel
MYGYSKLGSHILKELFKNNKDVILIEPDKKLFDLAQKEGFAKEYYNFECYDDEDLIAIGINKQNLHTFYCLHNDFNKNLFVTLSVRNLRNDINIISQTRDENDAKKLKLAGASKILNPYELTGLKIFRYLHRPMALKIIDDILYGDSTLTIEEITIKKDSKLDGTYLKDTTIFEEYNLIVLGLQDTEITHEFIFTSRGMNHKMDVGDTIVVMGEKNNIRRFKENI